MNFKALLKSYNVKFINFINKNNIMNKYNNIITSYHNVYTNKTFYHGFGYIDYNNK